MGRAHLRVVAFVCCAELPDSSYILKSQALVLAGYAFLLGAPDGSAVIVKPVVALRILLAR